MRVLSFVPAFFLAAASLAAAAPASTAASTSCISPPVSGNGNDVALQPVISIIVNATTNIQPLSAQLASMKGDSCTPDAVSSIVVQISDIVSNCVTQLQSTSDVDMTGLDLTNLSVAIYGLSGLVFTVLNVLFTTVVSLGADAAQTLHDVISSLLHVVINLIGSLQVFTNSSLAGVLGPVIALMYGVADLLLVQLEVIA